MGARTDVRWLCQGCATRFAGLSCPSCGKSTDSRSDAMPILDLARQADRGALRDVLSHEEEIRAPRAIGGHVVTGVLFVLAVLSAGTSFFVAIGFVALALFLDMRRRIKKRGVLHGAINVSAPALSAPKEDRVVRSGKVRCVVPLIAPISGQRCAAFRIAGTYGPFRVDDAAAAPFVLVGTSGETMVLPGSALVELEPPTPGKVFVSASLKQFFGSLGLAIQSGDEVEVGETLLHEGEHVEVEGYLDLSGGGYRASSGDVLAGRTDSPMLIRAEP